MLDRDERDDETGMDYMLARYYSNSLDRFLSPDPSRLGVDRSKPLSWNRYTYVLNNPMAYIDPNGLFEENFHAGWTYMLAKQAGFSEADARAISKANAKMDHGKTNPFLSASNRRKYHGFEANRDDAKAAALAAKGNAQLGQALHNFQDTYTHEGLPASTGQLSTGTLVDSTSARVSKSVEAATETYDVLQQQAAQQGKTGFGAPDAGLLEAMARADADVTSYDPSTNRLVLKVDPGREGNLAAALAAKGYKVLIDGVSYN